VKDVKKRLIHEFNKSKFLFIAILVVIIDQMTKYLVNENFETFSQDYKIFKNLNLVYVLNKGISFGLLSQMNISFYLGIISMVISIFIIFLIFKSKNKIELLGLSFILGGAVGNGLDRIINSYVIDFIDFHISDFHWPAFNFADFFITIGALFYIYASFKIKKS